MKTRSSCSRVRRWPVTNRSKLCLLVWAVAAAFLWVPRAAGSAEAPAWMKAVASVSLPAYSEKTNAVLAYSEKNVTVLSANRIKTRERRVYRILRPGGREYGVPGVFFQSPRQKITSLRGWCIPAQGKDYEVTDKDAVIVSAPKIEGSELISDLRYKLLRIPASEPGNLVGYEYEIEEEPLVLQDVWDFQRGTPAHESHYTLELPAGWEYKTSWLNYPEVKPVRTGANQWHWVVNHVRGIRNEAAMPPRTGVAGQMIVTFFPSGTTLPNVFLDWRGLGTWYTTIISNRRAASPGLKQKVAELTSAAPASLAKMRALADFVQHDIRYVAIELGIGSWQPHPAAEVFTHRYGDCKDKANLMAAMLQEIGVESYLLPINTRRGAVSPEMPVQLGRFNHVILAIALPQNVTDASLVATLQRPRLGRLLFFDPTDELTPFGQISGNLQSNSGLLVAPNGGELLELPKLPVTMNGISRTGTFTLDPSGTLKGEVRELRQGDRAWSQRWALRTVKKDVDQVKPIEDLLASSLSTFTVERASVINLQQSDQPFGLNYAFEAKGYARKAGGLLLLRPRVLGSKSSGLLETKEPRRFPVEFEGLVKDTDTFEIAMPAGYAVDDLPLAVNVDYSFASYHSRTEASGNLIRYTRSFEIKELSVPLSKMEELKKFYRIIAGDERSAAVLVPSSK